MGCFVIYKRFFYSGPAEAIARSWILEPRHMPAATRSRRLHTAVSFVLGFATPVVIWAQVSGLIEWKNFPFVAWLVPLVAAWRAFDDPPLGLYESRRADVAVRGGSVSTVEPAGEQLSVLGWSITGERLRFLWHSVKAGIWSFVFLVAFGITLGMPLPTAVWQTGLGVGALAALIGWHVPPHSPVGVLDRSTDSLPLFAHERSSDDNAR